MRKGCAIPGCQSQFAIARLITVSSTPLLAQWWKDAPWSSVTSGCLKDTKICTMHFREDQLDCSETPPTVNADVVPSVNLPSIIENKRADNENKYNALLVYCRFCGKKQKKPIQIHLEDLVESETLLQLCLGHSRFLEGYPSGICDHCLQIVKVTTFFIRDCEKAQEKLQKLFFGTSPQFIDSFNKQEEQESDSNLEIPEVTVLLDEPNASTNNELNPFDQNEFEMQSLSIADNIPDPLVIDLQAKAKLTKRKSDDHGEVNCTVCDRIFNRKRALKAHMESVHEGRVFACPICGKTMGWRKTLQRHMKSHEENYYKHKCELCDKSFSRPSHLKLHMTKHTGVRVRCPLCSSGFRCNYKLGDHLTKSHTLDQREAKEWVRKAEKY